MITITLGDIRQVQDYLPLLSEFAAVWSVPQGTLPPNPSFCVRDDPGRPKAPDILQRIASAIRNGTGTEREAACRDLSDLFYSVWGGGLPNGGKLVWDRGDVDDPKIKGWGRVQSQKYLTDGSMVTGEILAVFLNAPRAHDAEVVRKTQAVVGAMVPGSEAHRIVGYQTRPHMDLGWEAHMLDAYFWTDTAAYVTARFKDAVILKDESDD